jgi:hypothetical protein
LVIAGVPGSGKSGAAVLLVLAALQHRSRVHAEDRVKVPVPVLFTVQDWNPRRQPVKDWLTGRLQQTYPLFTGRTGAADAGRLIDAGKITVILDGLDEITEELRPAALQALDQADFRVVVLSRTAEMASAASQRGVLQGAAAVELHAIDPAEAASYLERVQLDPPPDGWRDLISRIRIDPASPLTKALDNPLTLTLVRDTYQSGDDARDLLEFCDVTLHGVPGDQASEDITDHLLDRILPAAYTHRPGQPPLPYDLPTAQNTLTKIAERMNQDGIRDLQWWRIPVWAPPAQRFVVGGLVFGLVFGVVVGLLRGLGSGLAFGLGIGIAVGFFSLGGHPPQRMGKLRLRKVFTWENLVSGLVFGLVSGLVGGLVFGLAVGLAVGLVVGLSVGFVLGFMDALAAAPDSTRSLSPVTSWRDDRKYGLVVGLVGGLVVGLVGGLVVGLRVGVTGGLESGFVVGLLSGLVGGLTCCEAWAVCLTAAQIAIKWRTPLRLMRFLSDACDRNILRTVGTTYQFRHSRLQDRLTANTSRRRD